MKIKLNLTDEDLKKIILDYYSQYIILGSESTINSKPVINFIVEKRTEGYHHNEHDVHKFTGAEIEFECLALERKNQQ